MDEVECPLSLATRLVRVSPFWLSPIGLSLQTIREYSAFEKISIGGCWQEDTFTELLLGRITTINHAYKGISEAK